MINHIEDPLNISFYFACNSSSQLKTKTHDDPTSHDDDKNTHRNSFSPDPTLYT